MEPIEDVSQTRTFDTPFGTKTYAEISDLIAEPLRVTMNEIARGEFSDLPLDTELIRGFHRRILQEVIPDIAGKWRQCAVRVGSHYPPEHIHVPRRMLEMIDHVHSRLQYADDNLDFQIEALAYIEAEFLHIHPFTDFNGRAVRLLLAELMQRLDLPVVPLYVEKDTAAFRAYLAALRVYDTDNSLFPLKDFWAEYRFGVA
ncbi:Fic family protein [Nocardia sp. N2S4-5]|uniref:Fic family protein n=1 Tax=Nocardia sp. N2S4-5 TaxID=3351565 RepID=UPI0037CFD5B5